MFSAQLPAGRVGGPPGDPSSVYTGQHQELQLSSSSAGQQQRLWFISAAVCRELPSGKHASEPIITFLFRSKLLNPSQSHTKQKFFRKLILRLHDFLEPRRLLVSAEPSGAL